LNRGAKATFLFTISWAAKCLQRAKNRECRNVVTLWLHTGTGNSEHLQRMLYNAITRATTHCSVIVLGRGRLNQVRFSAVP
jgi:hypothetical protein